MDRDSESVRTQHGRNTMADGPLTQEEVRKIEEWRESMKRCDRNRRIGVIIVIFLAMTGLYYGAGWMRGDETRGKILHIAFDIVLIGGVIVISLLANEIWKLLSTILLFLNDISQRLKK
jgi:hypothetical protein